MKLVPFWMRAFVPLFAIVALNPALADDPIPITADQAFIAVQQQVNPVTDESATVVLVDVRDPQEILSSGAAARVEEIVFLSGQANVEPDWGMVRLVHDGKFIEYQTDGRRNRVKMDEIEALFTRPIAYNIKLWDQTESGFDEDTYQATADAFAEGSITKLFRPLRAE